MREMTSAERDVLEAMIRRADGFDDDAPTEADRARWISAVDSLWVPAVCGCGGCPSFELSVRADGIAEADGPRRVLNASTADGRALVMLFIDADVPSYLEVAPIDDDGCALPVPGDLVFRTAE